MNCAPIDVTGGASDGSKLDTLPDTLFANVGINSCKQVENKAIKFPNPGKEADPAGSDAVAPTGDCGSSGGSGDSSPAPGSGASSAPASKPSSAAAGQPSSAAAGQPSSAPKPTNTGAASKPTPTGGVFAPGASSAASKPTTLATAVAPSAPAGTAAPPAGTSAPSTGAPSTGAPSSGAPSSGGGATGSCSEDGAIVCNGATQFGICNKGQVTWQAVAAGTQCANGVIAKRGYNGRIARPRV